MRKALLLTAVLLCTSSATKLAHADDVVISDEARRHFQAGVILLEDPNLPRYEDAYREFKEAYAVSPSYKILGNLGLCAMKLERDDEAIEAYEKYLKEGGAELDPADRAQVERDLVTLRAGVVHVDVSSDPPGALITDVRVPVQGDRVTNVYGPLDKTTRIGVRKGHHVLTARIAGRQDVVWEVETSGSEMPAHVFTLPEVAAAPPVAVAQTPAPLIATRPVPTSVYVGVGATAVFGVATIVTGIVALKHQSDFDRLNDGFHVAEAESKRSSGKTLNLVTDLFLAGTVIAGGVTAYLFVTRPTVHVAPAVGKNGGGAFLTGLF